MRSCGLSAAAAGRGFKMMPLHYKGSGDTIKDLVSGEVKIMFTPLPPVVGFVKEGRLQGIATTGRQRDPALSELPRWPP